MVHSVTALLEFATGLEPELDEDEKPWQRNFALALDALQYVCASLTHTRPISYQLFVMLGVASMCQRCVPNVVLSCSTASPMSRNSREMKQGMELAMWLQQALVRVGNQILTKKQMVHTDYFYHVVLDYAPDHEVFTRPLALSKLALFLTDALAVRPLPTHLCLPDVLWRCRCWDDVGADL